MKMNKLSTIGDNSMCPVAVVVRDQKILLGLRHYTMDKWKKISVWTMPGGRCDSKERIETTLRREIQEEVGITDIEIKDFIGEVPGAKKGDTVLIFHCTTKQEIKLMEPEKFSEWRWVPVNEYLAGGRWSKMNPLLYKTVSEYLKKNVINKGKYKKCVAGDNFLSCRT